MAIKIATVLFFGFVDKEGFQLFSGNYGILSVVSLFLTQSVARKKGFRKRQGLRPFWYVASLETLRRIVPKPHSFATFEQPFVISSAANLTQMRGGA